MKVLVTGASGFIGGRLVERLVRQGADVRVLVRNPASAARLARFPLTFHLGDVTNAADLEKAVQGCGQSRRVLCRTAWRIRRSRECLNTTSALLRWPVPFHSPAGCDLASPH